MTMNYIKNRQVIDVYFYCINSLLFEYDILDREKVRIIWKILSLLFHWLTLMVRDGDTLSQ
jgi:hypothetical protein